MVYGIFRICEEHVIYLSDDESENDRKQRKKFLVLGLQLCRCSCSRFRSRSRYRYENENISKKPPISPKTTYCRDKRCCTPLITYNFNTKVHRLIQPIALLNENIVVTLTLISRYRICNASVMYLHFKIRSPLWLVCFK